jgi:hypothetical protein
MKQNADHIHKQARTYTQKIRPKELVAITPDTILSKTGYIQNLLPVCLSFSFLSGLSSFHQVSHQTNNRYIICSALNKSCQTLTNSETIADCAALGLRQRVLLNQRCTSFGGLGGLDW